MNNFHRPAAILTGVTALLITVFVASPSKAQDKKEQKVTVVAKSDSKDKDGKINVHIIKEENGKKTEIDTVISSKGGIDGKELEVLMEKVNSKMKEVGDQMKDIELYIGSMNDSSVNDSSGHHKYMFKFPGTPGCPKIRIKECPQAFNYNFEMPDVPEPPEGPEDFNNDFFNQWTPGPQVFSMPKRGESLSDVLGDIPMSRVKSYKIIDKKGGKRIVIDLEDGPYFEHNDRIIYFNGPRHQVRAPRGMKNQKDIKVIIKTEDDKDNAEQPESPAPPAEPKK
ncbi:MAG: hypothetical protein NTY96_03215 [Bacteroidetes bacterium]|nr:hypothetical protein [Bacteroidota bacterium]